MKAAAIQFCPIFKNRTVNLQRVVTEGLAWNQDCIVYAEV